MQNKLFAHKTIVRPSRSIHHSINIFEWFKMGFLACISVVLLFMFLFLRNITSTAGHALNQALKGFDVTTQSYSATQYQLAGIDDNVFSDKRVVSIPTTSLGYNNKIVAVSENTNFALNK